MAVELKEHMRVSKADTYRLQLVEAGRAGVEAGHCPGRSTLPPGCYVAVGGSSDLIHAFLLQFRGVLGMTTGGPETFPTPRHAFLHC